MTHNHAPPDPAAFIAAASDTASNPSVVRSFTSPITILDGVAITILPGRQQEFAHAYLGPDVVFPPPASMPRTTCCGSPPNARAASGRGQAAQAASTASAHSADRAGHQPAGRHCDPVITDTGKDLTYPPALDATALKLTEGGSRKGGSVLILSDIDRKSKVLFY